MLGVENGSGRWKKFCVVVEKKGGSTAEKSFVDQAPSGPKGVEEEKQVKLCRFESDKGRTKGYPEGDVGVICAPESPASRAGKNLEETRSAKNQKKYFRRETGCRKEGKVI